MFGPCPHCGEPLRVKGGPCDHCLAMPEPGGVVFAADPQDAQRVKFGRGVMTVMILLMALFLIAASKARDRVADQRRAIESVRRDFPDLSKDLEAADSGPQSEQFVVQAMDWAIVLGIAWLIAAACSYPWPFQGFVAGLILLIPAWWLVLSRPGAGPFTPTAENSADNLGNARESFNGSGVGDRADAKLRSADPGFREQPELYALLAR